MQIEKIAWGGWDTCYRIFNDFLELIVTADVGPRILHFSAIGGDNVFGVDPEHQGKVGGDQWRPFGGHRLWHSPEDRIRTYQPDNFPVTVDAEKARFVAPIEPKTGIGKSLQIVLEDQMVTVIHTLWNHNLWEVELAAWALTVMARGGIGIMPLPERGSHEHDLLPNSRLVVWPYTDLSDERIDYRRSFVGIRQDPSIVPPLKFGIHSPLGWLAYANAGTVFVKQYQTQFGGDYPDMGCSAEIFANDEILELETLSPLVRVPPGGTVQHLERWRLLRDVPLPLTDANIKLLMPE